MPAALAPRLVMTRLRASVAPQRRRIGVAGLLLVADAFAAIGFAAGLAFGLAALPRGLAAAAPWLALLTGAATARGLLALASAELAGRAAEEVKSAVRRNAAQVLARRLPGDSHTAGALMTRVVEGAEALDGFITRFMPARMAAGVAPLVIIAAIAVASPISAGILLATLAPFVLGMALAGLAAAEESRRQFEALARLSGVFLDRIRALPLILAFEAQAAQSEAMGAHAEDLRRRTARVLRLAFLSSGVLEFFAALSVALVAVYCGFNLLRLLPFPVPETLTLPRAFFALALAPEVYAPMRRLAAAYHDKQQAEAATTTVDLPPASSQSAMASTAFSRAPRLRFCGATVRYPETDRAILANFNLDLAAGGLTAILGASGAGKTSLLNLLLGRAPLSAGEVWVGAMPLSSVKSFAPAVAWVGQSTLIVPGTFADNIALARRDATRTEIAAVALRVGLQPALDARAGGLDAWIDERGGGLSGGERRRLALARALLKRASILLLDEPTAGLNAADAERLMPVIKAAARGRTTLIATHSAAVAALADRVVTL